MGRVTARPMEPPKGREFDFPPTSGVWSGWFGLVFVAGTITVIAWHGFTPLGVRFIVGLVLAGVLIYAFMLRPRIQVRGGAVRLVNPFDVVEIPLPLVRSVLVRSATYVFVDDRRKKYVGVAVGRDPRDLTRSRNGTWIVGRGSESFTGYRRPDGSAPAPVALQVPDILEEWVERLARDARAHDDGDDLKVERTLIWPLILPTLALAVLLAVVVMAA
jgi:hypothetical protein